MDKCVDVLLVEDDRDLAESVSSYLSIIGFCVKTVGSSLEFYSELAENTYDVAVLDINLPDQSGLILAEYLKRNTDIGIIILTAQDNMETRIKSYESGSDVFLSKPIDCRELSAAIKNIISRRQPSGAVRSADKKCWVIDLTQRVLTTPDGASVQLTSKESKLLEQFASMRGEPVSRESLVLALYERDDTSTNQSLDTLISRTKKKISAEAGLSLPVLSEYGIGYKFCADIQSK